MKIDQFARTLQLSTSDFIAYWGKLDEDERKEEGGDDVGYDTWMERFLMWEEETYKGGDEDV